MRIIGWGIVNRKNIDKTGKADYDGRHSFQLSDRCPGRVCGGTLYVRRMI